MSAPVSVLVVDDSSGICRTLSLILKRKGFEVTCAGSGPEAVQRSRERAYDRIILDIKLPGFDGVEAQKRIKAHRPGAKVAIMTAYAVESLVAEAVRDGAEKVFYKPLDLDSVLSYLNGGEPEG